MTASFDSLIQDLGGDLRPIRRLRSPLVRAAGWLAGVAGLATVLALFANLPALGARLHAFPDLRLAMIGSALTMILGAIAVFQLSLPDRGAGWALLPLPGLALWLAGTGLGCLRDWGLPGVPAASMGETTDCFSFIVGLSIPLSVVLIGMIRRAFPLRPNLTAITGGLAAAAAAATLLNFFHPYDAGATDLAVHAVAIAVVIGCNRLLGGRLLSARVRRRS